MKNYAHLSIIVKYLIEHYREPFSLEKLAEVSDITPMQLQQIVKEWAGVSTEQYMGYLTIDALKKELTDTGHLIGSTGKVNVSSSSFDGEQKISVEAVSPDIYKSGGKGLSMEYGFTDSPFGRCFVAATPHGICHLQFVEEDEEMILAGHLKEWSMADHKQNDVMADSVVRNICSGYPQAIKLHLKGTTFQLKVWEALLAVPSGCIVTYSGLAQLIHYDRAVRAVASAVARNPVGWIIPCHRVIRNEGIVGQYHWKSERKACMIGWERARRDRQMK